jgi:hypothetical protein
MTVTPTFGALGINARRILDFLMVENSENGGRENGNLCAPYDQLERRGCTRRDIRSGLTELEVLGFVECTKPGLRLTGDGEPARYRITHLPTFKDGRWVKPGDEWFDTAAQHRRDGRLTARAVRAWLRTRCDGR